MKRLPEAELQVMLIVWEAGEPVNSQYVLERLAGKRTWKKATLLTVMNRLTEKGYLSCQKQYRNNLFTAEVKLDDYRENESKNLLERFHNDSISEMVTYLMAKNSISENEKVKLRGLLKV